MALGIAYIVVEIEMFLLVLSIQWRRRENSAVGSTMLLESSGA